MLDKNEGGSILNLFAIKRIVLFVFLIAFVLIPVIALALPSTTITTSNIILGNAFIPQGTVVPVQLMESPGLKTLFVGKALAFKILEPIVVGGTVVVEKGYVGYAVVTQVKKIVSKRAVNDGPEVIYATVEFRPHSIKTLNWIEVPLTISVWANLSEVQASQSLNDQARELIEAQFRSNRAKECGTDCSSQPKFFVAVDADVDLLISSSRLAKDMPKIRMGVEK